MHALKRSAKVLLVAMCLVLSVVGAAYAANTVAIATPVDGATTLSGTVTLDAGATLGTTHTYQVDGGASTPLTVAANAFTIDISALANGNHTVQVFVEVDPDGAGATPASNVTTTRSFIVASGAIDVPASGGGLTFTVPTSGLGASVSDSLTSMSTLFYLVGGLVVAAGIVGFGIRLLKSWRS